MSIPEYRFQSGAVNGAPEPPAPPSSRGAGGAGRGSFATWLRLRRQYGEERWAEMSKAERDGLVRLTLARGADR